MTHRPEVLHRIQHFVTSTREAVFIRRADDLLLIRPDKTMQVNRSALDILDALYGVPPDVDPGETLAGLARRLRVDEDRLLADADQLLLTVGALLNEDYSPRDNLRFGSFDRGAIQYPTIAEIALTYACNARCVFCYAAAPERGKEREKKVMTTAEVKRVMERIYHEAHVPSLSFTGGEATLRRDLPELIRYGRELGFRVNLITNGLKSGDPAFARGLVEAGLNSAQVSLEAATPELHDALVGKAGAWERTVAAVRNFRALGIHVHTNTTLSTENLDHGPELLRFLARDLGLSTCSMNMVIPTGDALGPKDVGVRYAQVTERIPGLLEVAEAEGIRLVWYSPVPYCVFNPVLSGLGAKSCACIDGILSVDPAGQVLPCSSFEDGIGSLLERPFEEIYASEQARYWKEKRFVPTACEGCPNLDVCGGACPLYWDAAGSFEEIRRAGSADPAAWERWRRGRAAGGSEGVRPRAPMEV